MAKQILTQEYVRSLFHYDPETGVLTWKERPREHFATEGAWKVMNARCAGKPVGSSHRFQGDYLALSLRGRKYLVHRMIWFLVYGYWPDEIDHINGKRADNRLVNLRDVSRPVNMKNKRVRRDSKTGIPGVMWHKAAAKWCAQIRVSGRMRHLGVFGRLEDAIAARKAAEKEFGYHENHGRL